MLKISPPLTAAAPPSFACSPQAVADIVRSTLGPKSMLKMLLDPMGGIVITNDGNAILREIDVAHPAAKSMLELSRSQDEEVGDGTTSVIILAGEMLVVAEPFLSRNMHPTVIVNAYHRALEASLATMEKLAINITVSDREEMRRLIRSSLATKFTSRYGDIIADLALDAGAWRGGEEVELGGHMRVTAGAGQAVERCGDGSRGGRRSGAVPLCIWTRDLLPCYVAGYISHCWEAWGGGEVIIWPPGSYRPSSATAIIFDIRPALRAHGWSCSGTLPFLGESIIVGRWVCGGVPVNTFKFAALISRGQNTHITLSPPCSHQGGRHQRRPQGDRHQAVRQGGEDPGRGAGGLPRD